MKKIISLLALGSVACALVACTGDDTSTPTDSGTTDTGTTDTGTTDSGNDSGNTPAPPKLGTEIDRMGRPAINTALNNVLEKDAGVANAATSIGGWMTVDSRSQVSAMRWATNALFAAIATGSVARVRSIGFRSIGMARATAPSPRPSSSGVQMYRAGVWV